MDLIDRYSFLVVELARDYIELAWVKQQRTATRIDSYATSDARNGTERDQRADVASVSWHRDALELEGLIAAREVEIQWCRDLLARGVTVWHRDEPHPESATPTREQRIARAGQRAVAAGV